MNEGLTFSKSQLLNSLRWPIYVINSFDNTKLPCYTPPPTQHHSFLRNVPPFFIVMRQSVYKKYLWKPSGKIYFICIPISKYRGVEVMGKEAWKQITRNKKCMADLKRLYGIFATYFLFYNLHVIFCNNYFLDFGIKKDGKWRKLIGYKNL